MQRPAQVPQKPEAPKDGDVLSFKEPTAVDKLKSGTRSMLLRTGAYAAIFAASAGGGAAAGEGMSGVARNMVHPAIHAIDEAVTPRMCSDQYEGFKGIVLGKMNGTAGKILNTVLNSVDMQDKVQKWVNAIAGQVDKMRQEMCDILKNIPDLTKQVEEAVQSITKTLTQILVFAMIFLALSGGFEMNRFAARRNKKEEDKEMKMMRKFQVLLNMRGVTSLEQLAAKQEEADRLLASLQEEVEKLRAEKDGEKRTDV